MTKSKGSGQAEVVKKLLADVEEKLKAEGLKVTLGDYIKLVQLQKELELDEPREIRVRWMDESESSSET
jgi:hypothetical protein